MTVKGLDERQWKKWRMTEKKERSNDRGKIREITRKKEWSELSGRRQRNENGLRKKALLKKFVIVLMQGISPLRVQARFGRNDREKETVEKDRKTLEK